MRPMSPQIRAVVLEIPVLYWACPSCEMTDRTQRPGPHTQFHACPGLGGLNAPLVIVAKPDDKPDARHVPQEREDFMGDELAPRIMSLRTDHGDGRNDILVFAPTATTKAD